MFNRGATVSTAYVVDADGTIIRGLDTTILERLMLDFYDTQAPLRKIGLALHYVPVKLFKSFAPYFGKWFGEEETTGETTSLQVFNIFMLRKAGMPLIFVKESAKEYAKYIRPKHVEALKKCKGDLYIVSAEPVELLEAIVKEAGLSDYVKKIYGNRFKVRDGIIVGFEKKGLFAGMRGKYRGMEKIILRGYHKIRAIGDSVADTGLFDEIYFKEELKDEIKETLGPHHNFHIRPYTFDDSPKSVIESVSSKHGSVVKDLIEIFK